MKRKNNIYACLMLLVSFAGFSQQGYQYKQALNGINDTWHTVSLPDAIFGKLSPNMADIRIKGVTAKKDTVEAPYLLKIEREKTVTEEIAFTTLNNSFNHNGYFYTFKMSETEPVNHLKLNFASQNFDWKVRLEGSENGKEWFTVVEDYRIVSIKNEATNFKFTTLSFPSITYPFLRLLVKSNTDPKLTSTSIYRETVSSGIAREYNIKKTRIAQNETNNTTEIEIELPIKVPVSKVALYVKDSFDYYRPITVQYVSDSVQTEQGWYYNYKKLASGTFHSMGGDHFSFPDTVLKKLKITVYNNDNEPLTFGTLKISGYEHLLLARFTTPADYFLVYGNKDASKPRYDIQQFTNKIPEKLTALTLGKVQQIDVIPEKKTKALFENEAWLWAIMALIIFILGWFTFKMIKKA
jgi:hypothetical protein